MKNKPVICRASWLSLLLPLFVCFLHRGLSFMMGCHNKAFSAGPFQCIINRSNRGGHIYHTAPVLNNPMFAFRKHRKFKSALEMNGKDEPIGDGAVVVQPSEETMNRYLRRGFSHAFLDLLGVFASTTLQEHISCAYSLPFAYEDLNRVDANLCFACAATEMYDMCELDYCLSLPPDDPLRLAAKVETMMGPSWKRRYDLMKVADVVNKALENEVYMMVLDVFSTIAKLTYELSMQPCEFPYDDLEGFLMDLQIRLLEYKQGARGEEMYCFENILKYMIKHEVYWE